MSDDQRMDYGYFCDISTRWLDNDIYGHVNNVVYYSYFDSIVNKYLIEQEDWIYIRRVLLDLWLLLTVSISPLFPIQMILMLV